MVKMVNAHITFSDESVGVSFSCNSYQCFLSCTQDCAWQPNIKKKGMASGCLHTCIVCEIDNVKSVFPFNCGQHTKKCMIKPSVTLRVVG